MRILQLNVAEECHSVLHPSLMACLLRVPKGKTAFQWSSIQQDWRRSFRPTLCKHSIHLLLIPCSHTWLAESAMPVAHPLTTLHGLASW